MNPKSQAAKNYRDALELYRAGKPSGAAELLESSSSQLADHHHAQFVLGVSRYDLGDYETALEALDRSLRINPHQPKALYYAGLTYERLGDKEQAIRAHGAALAEDPGFSPPQKKLARLSGRAREVGEVREVRAAEPSRQVAMSDFYIPRDDQELETYRERKIKKERANFWIAAWHGQPVIFRVVIVLTVLVGAAIMVGLAAGFADTVGGAGHGRGGPEPSVFGHGTDRGGTTAPARVETAGRGEDSDPSEESSAAEFASTKFGARLRQEPGLRGRTLMRIPEGRRVRILERRQRGPQTWLKVRHENREGWISEIFLRPGG